MNKGVQMKEPRSVKEKIKNFIKDLLIQIFFELMKLLTTETLLQIQIIDKYKF